MAEVIIPTHNDNTGGSCWNSGSPLVPSKLRSDCCGMCTNLESLAIVMGDRFEDWAADYLNAYLYREHQWHEAKL